MATKDSRSRVPLPILLLLSPFFVLYGVCVILWLPVRFVRWLAGIRAALRSSIRCPNGHPNATSGRWECRRCGAQYLGWVGRCPICKAAAGWFECSVCQAGIRLPWVS